MAEVKLERLGKRFSDSEVIQGLTLTVHDGELFTIVGPSGSGKSTLLHLIAGLEGPTTGRIFFDDLDVTALPPRTRDVALVFQNYALYPHMTVAENLAFPLRVAGRKSGMDRARIQHEVKRMADILGLSASLLKRPRELSGGQQQRVALGRALIRKPRVFLLDEPLSNLDAQLRADMRAELRRLHGELKITTIYVTHDQTEAMTLADRLAVLDRGFLQQVGSPWDLYNEPANLFVASFIGQPPMNLLDARVARGQIMADPIQIPLPANLTDIGVQHEGDRVKLGIRPEQVQVSDLPAVGNQTGVSGRAVTGIIRLIEPTGGQTWVTAEVGVADGVTTLVGLACAGFRGRPGKGVTISVAGACPLLFDLRTGDRLRA
ncbi:MAG: ABC transporter ATP-binding protein [Nitrospiraceae bacterium]